MSDGACGRCRRRVWLLGRLAAHIEVVRSRLDEVLSLDDRALIDTVAGADGPTVRSEYRSWRPTGSTGAAVCCCSADYPAALRELAAPPPVIHLSGRRELLGELAAAEGVSIVGSRRPTSYGAGVAEWLARALAGAGVPVISGLAPGIDSAAHSGALAGGGLTVAVLPSAPDSAYPRSHVKLLRRIHAEGLAVGELGFAGEAPSVRRWMFLARNRVVAALSRLTIVVEARERSGSLLTAEIATQLGRVVAAVPGQITAPQAAGSNALLAGGARAVRHAQDVLDLLYGPGARSAAADSRPIPSPSQRMILEAIAAGSRSAGALARAGVGGPALLEGLAALELSGHLVRGAGGRYTVLP
jgi:DNA processing protein